MDNCNPNIQIYNECFSTFCLQNFSIPNSIMFYFAKNPPSTEFYQKMVKCCKYFYIKNRLLILHCLCYFQNESKWEICTLKNHQSEDCFKDFPLHRISQSKIWIPFRYINYSPLPLSASNLIRNLYKCDAVRVHLVQQILTFKEFLFLAQKAQLLKIEKLTVTSENGSKVPLEIIVQNLPNLDTFCCTFSPETMDHSSNIMENLLKIPHFKNFKYFSLQNVSENFDFETFYNFAKENFKVKTALKYREPISDQLKHRLEDVIDYYLERYYAIYKPPYIEFPGQDEDQKEEFKKYRSKRI